MRPLAAFKMGAVVEVIGGSIVVLVGNRGSDEGATGGADDDADACFKCGLVMQEGMSLEDDSTDARATYIGNLIGIVGDIEARCKHLCNTNRTLVWCV